MKPAVFFPHAYLPNDIMLRHQFLYARELHRMHSSERPARDRKEVKKFIKDAAYPQDIAPQPGDEDVTRRMIAALEQAYDHKNDIYLQNMGKFGVERASTKTVNLCLLSEWPDLTKKLIDQGFIKNDLSDTWCMSTPTLVQMMATCAAVVQQAKDHVARTTNDALFDGQAVLVETLPIQGGSNTKIRRASLEFRYAVPDGIEAMEVEPLAKLREALLPLTEPIHDAILGASQSLDGAGDDAAMKEALKHASEAVGTVYQSVCDSLRSKGYKPADCSGQYRWYPQPDSALAKQDVADAIVEKHAALSNFQVDITADRMETVREYPGCFIWTLEASRFQGGFFKKLFGW